MKKVYIAPMMELQRLASTTNLLSGSSTPHPAPTPVQLDFNMGGTAGSGISEGL